MNAPGTLHYMAAGGIRVVRVTLTTEHPASSYGLPVAVADGEPYGPGDVWGWLELDVEDEHAVGAARRAGYDVRPKGGAAT